MTVDCCIIGYDEAAVMARSVVVSLESSYKSFHLYDVEFDLC
jgi:hypothetical protein